MYIKSFLKKIKPLFFFVKFLKIRVFKTNSEIDNILLKKLYFNISIDIGSNYGSYTSILRNNSKKVISVEPNISILNLQKKILGYKRIHYYNIAIGDEDNEVILNIPFKNNSYVYEEAYISDAIFSDKYYHVNQKIGDELFYDLECIDFIKIDVEGYENKVLESLSKSITKFLPIILIEIEVRHSSKQNINKLIDNLKGSGYQFYYMKNGQNLSKIKDIDFDWISNIQNDLNYKKDINKSIYNSKSTKYYINNFWCINQTRKSKYDQTLSKFWI